ncbi:MAG: hypothetical protein IH988_02125 [Planctomycetes bacterium]|nr:hypothetical protein [Planctomycetota bacterium]
MDSELNFTLGACDILNCDTLFFLGLNDDHDDMSMEEDHDAMNDDHDDMDDDHDETDMDEDAHEEADENADEVDEGGTAERSQRPPKQQLGEALTPGPFV